MTEPRPHWRNIIRPLSRLIWFRTSSCLRDKRATIMSRSWSRPSEVFVEELEFLFRCSRPCVICPPDDGAVFWRLRNPSVHASSRSENDWSSPVWCSILVQGQLQECTVSGQDLCNAHEYVFHKVQLVHKGVMDAHAIKLNIRAQLTIQGPGPTDRTLITEFMNMLKNLASEQAIGLCN